MPLSQEESKSQDLIDKNSKELPKNVIVPAGRQVYVFGNYRLDGQQRRLWHHDVALMLPPKAFDLLLVLVQNSGELLEKQQLLRAVWPDSFVEEANLTVYVSALRKIFNKFSPNIELIETIPKWGYRFTASVAKDSPSLNVVKSQEPVPSIPATQSEPARVIPDEIGTPIATIPEGARFRPLWIVAPLVIAIVLLGIFLLTHRSMARPSAMSANSRPLTSLPGSFSHPAFSSDGQRLAYSWHSATDQYQSIYIQSLKTDDRTRLTDTGGNDFSPAWSPHDENIAFLHSQGNDQPLQLFVVNSQSPLVPKRLATISGFMSAFRNPPSLSWSPDNQWLLTTDCDGEEQNPSLTLISVETGAKKTLTHAPPRVVDDEGAFSPDGKLVAFRRALGNSSDDVYVIPASGGEERRLTFQTQSIDGLAWSPDGQSLVVSSGRATSVGSLWRVSLNGDPAVALTPPLVHTSSPAVSAAAHRLAYVDFLRNVSLWRTSIDKHGPPTQFIASDFLDSAADYSPDGTHIAFRSDRSGANEVWICNSDGTNPKKATTFDGPMTGSPRWSPDSQWLAFDSRFAGRADIYIVNVSGGSPIRVTNGSADNSDNVVPSWSHDGHALYFSSNRTGVWQIWRKSIQDNSESQITRDGGFAGVESRDGLNLYYVRDTSTTSIWRLPMNGGKSVKVIDALGPGMWGYWAVTGENLFYFQRKSVSSAFADIFRFNLTTGSIERMGQTEHGVNPNDRGLAISPDGHWLLYAQRDVDRSSIMLVDDWE